MCGMAALRSGAGLVTVASEESAIPVIAGHAAELMTEPLDGRPRFRTSSRTRMSSRSGRAWARIRKQWPWCGGRSRNLRADGGRCRWPERAGRRRVVRPRQAPCAHAASRRDGPSVRQDYRRDFSRSADGGAQPGYRTPGHRGSEGRAYPDRVPRWTRLDQSHRHARHGHRRHGRHSDRVDRRADWDSFRRNRIRPSPPQSTCTASPAS